MIPVEIVSDIDWAVLALTGFIAVASLIGAVYIVPWTRGSRQQATTKEFNYLWITRFLLQLIGACYVLSLDLRLQVLWSYRSVLFPGGVNVDAMCRLYIGLSFGLLEPAFLLLVLFSCMYTVHKHTNDPSSNPNLFIFALTVGLTLPMCAAQVFAALFSRIITQLQYHEELMKEFFGASVDVPEMCPPDVYNPNCSVCVFPEFSTLISAAFALMYLVVLWYVLGRIANTAINKMLARRIRVLQICITVFFIASIALRGVTVIFFPFSLGFVALSLANVVVVCCLIVSVSTILVWVPVYDGRAADRRMKLQGHGHLVDAPTELLPLVGYKHHGGDGSSGTLHEPEASANSEDSCRQML